MDKLEHYRRLLTDVVTRHAQFIPSHGKIEPVAIGDTTHDQYLLMDIGWNETGRVHDVVFHARIKNEKIWIEWDGVSPSITEELLEAGVPKTDIVLAFYRPERRELTEFAVA